MRNEDGKIGRRSIRPIAGHEPARIVAEEERAKDDGLPTVDYKVLEAASYRPPGPTNEQKLSAFEGTPLFFLVTPLLAPAIGMGKGLFRSLQQLTARC